MSLDPRRIMRYREDGPSGLPSPILDDSPHYIRRGLVQMRESFVEEHKLWIAYK